MTRHSTCKADDAQAPATDASDPFAARWDDDALIVERPGASNGRTVLFVGFASRPRTLEGWLKGRFGGHHLWGAIELARAGYRIVMPDVEPRSSKLAMHLLSDRGAVLRWARRLGPDDIVYCNHNVMWWVPIMRRLGRVRAKLVALLYAAEPLPLAGAYRGIIGMTRIALDHALRLNRDAVCAHIPWGVELTDHHHSVRPYEPRWGLSCGVTGRDFEVVRQAYHELREPLRICARGARLGDMPGCIQIISDFVSPQDLIGDLYRQAAYVLIALQADPAKREAIGCTNLLEAMALGRPVIKTRTGSLDDDIDVEGEGIGLYVETGDAEGLKQAVRRIIDRPDDAEAMGRRGRALCERQYNMDRFGKELTEFLEAL
jgi:glycosyltransferase involved in cell wall biosynthesis